MELRSQMAVKESELKFLVSAAHSSESKLFWSKNVWEVAQIINQQTHSIFTGL